MSEVNEMTGKVFHIGETEVFDSGFRKRVLIIEAQDGNYTNQYGFELMKDKVDQLNGVNCGDEVTVKFNVGRAREWNGKWFGQMHTAWNVKASTTQQAQPEAPAQEGADVPADDDDLIPF